MFLASDESWARRNLTTATLTDAARAVGASQRTNERRVHHVLGKRTSLGVRELLARGES